MSGGLTNPAQCIAYTVSASVDYAGLIVTRDGSTGKMKLASASTEIPEGYTFTTSKNPVTGESQSGVKVGICALIPGHIATLMLPASHANVSIGDKIIATSNGMVTTAATTSSLFVIGTAEEATTSSTSVQPIKVRIFPYYGPTA